MLYVENVKGHLDHTGGPFLVIQSFTSVKGMHSYFISSAPSLPRYAQDDAFRTSVQPSV